MRATALLAFTALWGASQAQMPYQPFPDSNAVWTVTYNSSDCYFTGTPQQIYQYEYATDTLLTGISYHQLVRTHSCAGCCGGNVDGYVGALRQDTTARKVFFIPSWGMDEYLLYDLSLQPGDTLHSFLCGYPMVLATIDTLTTAAGPRRRFNYEGCWNYEIIEGVGSPQGIIGGGGVDSGENLECLRLNGQVVWENNVQGCLVSPLSAVTSEDKIATSMKAYPNPTTKEFSLEVTGQEPFSVILLDGMGRPVKRWSNVSVSARFDVSGLHSGCYTLVVVKSNGLMQHLKLIIE